VAADLDNRTQKVEYYDGADGSSGGDGDDEDGSEDAWSLTER
jgi:S-DNA-T family DNA segregation ATPase FtsK/SpoIIIE